MVTAAVVAFAGCGSSGEAAAAKNGPGGSPNDSAARGRGDEAAREGGRGPGRGAMSVVLGASDVAAVKRGPIEAAMAIQGDLKPIEEVPVRARIEGNVDAVLVREGDRVTRGQLLGRFESSNEESAQKSAEADVASARAELTNAQWNADQSAELFRAGAIPERDLRTAQQDLVAAQARLAAAEARLRASTQTLGDTRILSPTTGTIATRSVETGEHVTRGATIFTVVRNDVLELEASVPARFAGDVKPSLPVRFSAGGRNLDGHVARVSPTINPANRSVTVYLQVPNPGGALKGNTFATGRIVARTINDAIVIPTAAIRYQQAQPRPFVYRIANDVLEYQLVELGIVDEAMGVAQIVEGLQEGDRIVVGNVGALGRGVRVRIAGSPEQGRSNGGEAGGRAGREGSGGAGRGTRGMPRP
jgi:RND family efflux transporter MFP subunit